MTPQNGKPYIERCRKGFMGYKFGNAYGCKGELITELKAMYVLPWHN